MSPFASVTSILPSFRKRQVAALHSLKFGFSAALFDIGLQVSSSDAAWDDMIGQNGLSLALLSGFIKLSTVPLGRASKASFVGAKTVNGPLPDRVSTSLASFMAKVAAILIGSFRLPSC